MAISGGVPLSFTVPSMTACPAGGAAAATRPGAVVAPGATGAGAEAAGESFWQAPAMVDAASARMARPGLIMVVVLTGARRPVKRRVRLGWLDRKGGPAGSPVPRRWRCPVLTSGPQMRTANLFTKLAPE